MPRRRRVVEARGAVRMAPGSRRRPPREPRAAAIASSLAASSIPTVSIRRTPTRAGGRDELGVRRLAEAEMTVAIDHAAESRRAGSRSEVAAGEPGHGKRR